MAEENIPFAVTSITGPGLTMTDALGATVQRMVNRAPINAGANNTPIERPVQMEDARFVARCAVPPDPPDLATAPGACEVNFNEADASGTGSITVTPMVPGNYDSSAGHNESGESEVEFLMLGTTLDITVAV